MIDLCRNKKNSLIRLFLCETNRYEDRNKKRAYPLFTLGQSVSILHFPLYIQGDSYSRYFKGIPSLPDCIHGIHVCYSFTKKWVDDILNHMDVFCRCVLSSPTHSRSIFSSPSSALSSTHQNTNNGGYKI